MSYTREEIIDRLKNFEMGWEKPKGATAGFWRAVIDEIEQGGMENDRTVYGRGIKNNNQGA